MVPSEETWHMSRGQKRVLKLVNFFVQKPYMFEFWSKLCVFYKFFYLGDALGLPGGLPGGLPLPCFFAGALPFPFPFTGALPFTGLGLLVGLFLAILAVTLSESITFVSVSLN